MSRRSNPIRFALAFLLVVPGLWAQYPGATAVEGDPAKGFATIEEESCRSWLTTLSSDDFAGRKTGTEGHRKAAAFMAARFKEFGLQPVGDEGGYFQQVHLARMRPIPAESSVVVGSTKIPAEAGLVFGPFSGKVNGKALVIRAKGADAALPEGTVIKGKVVVVVGDRRIMLSPLRKSLEEGGAAALLWVGRPRIPEAILYRGIRVINAFRAEAWVDGEALQTLFKALELDAALSKVPTEDGVELIASQATIDFEVKAEKDEILAPNVVGFIEGSDPVLKKELVICGSHLDHIGVAPNGEINNGADDDGSGSTALLAIARAFGKSEVRPKRSLLFIAVCGEEDGLLGSEYYVENPIFPLADTVCELQMDMIGRNEESRKEPASQNIRTTHLVGSTKLSMDLHGIVLEANKSVGLEFEYDEEGVWNRSDHYNFAKHGIPIVFVFSGFHPDYHRSTDTVEKINFEKLANTARLIYLTAWTAADRPERIKKDGKLFEKKDGAAAEDGDK